MDPNRCHNSLHQEPLDKYGVEPGRKHDNPNNTDLAYLSTPPHDSLFTQPANSKPDEAKSLIPDSPSEKTQDDYDNNHIPGDMKFKFSTFPPPPLPLRSKITAADIGQTSDQAAVEQQQSRGLEKDMVHMINMKERSTKCYEVWHNEWSALETALREKAQQLRTEFAEVVEKIHRQHHHHERKKRGHQMTAEGRDGVNSTTLYDQMTQTFNTVRDVAFILGVMYAERGAVAQGAVPTWGETHGKLNSMACDPRIYLESIFPEFIPKENPVPVDDFAPDDLPLPTQPATLNVVGILGVWEDSQAKLKAIHLAAFESRWADVWENTREEVEVAINVLGGFV